MTEINQAIKGFNKLARLDDLVILPHARIDAWQTVREQQLPRNVSIVYGERIQGGGRAKKYDIITSYDISVDVH